MLKCVITIIQNKRVSLPFIFGRYCLPKMRECFGGDIELYHIFHDIHIEHDELASNKLHDGLHLDRVRMFVDSDVFSEATIIRHSEVNWEHLALPSFTKAAEIALERGADFHLWLEDDAIVLDKDCHNWMNKFKNSDIGIYRDTRKQKMVNSAFFVSTREFDEKILGVFNEYKRDRDNDYFLMGHGSQIEHTLWRTSKSQTLLNPRYATRHHPLGRWVVDISVLKKWLKDSIPEITREHMSYLHLDFDR